MNLAHLAELSILSQGPSSEQLKLTVVDHWGRGCKLPPVIGQQGVPDRWKIIAAPVPVERGLVCANVDGFFNPAAEPF